MIDARELGIGQGDELVAGELNAADGLSVHSAVPALECFSIEKPLTSSRLAADGAIGGECFDRLLESTVLLEGNNATDFSVVKYGFLEPRSDEAAFNLVIALRTRVVARSN